MLMTLLFEEIKNLRGSVIIERDDWEMIETIIHNCKVIANSDNHVIICRDRISERVY